MSEPRGKEAEGASKEGCRQAVSEYDEEVFEKDQLFPGSITPKNTKTVSGLGETAIWRTDKACQTPIKIAVRNQTEGRPLVLETSTERCDEEPSARTSAGQSTASERVFEQHQLYPGSITLKNAKLVSCLGRNQAEDRPLCSKPVPERCDEMSSQENNSSSKVLRRAILALGNPPQRQNHSSAEGPTPAPEPYSRWGTHPSARTTPELSACLSPTQGYHQN